MAKKKPNNAPEFAPGQPLAIRLRASAEWKQRVEDLAVPTVSGLVDVALARLANEIGFREPPER